MPRTARASRGGFCYHVINRGNGRAEVFHKDTDYQAFVRLIGDACARLPMRVLGYCLMPNHLHVVLWPHKDGDLSRWMQWRLRAHQGSGWKMRTFLLCSDTSSRFPLPTPSLSA